MCPGQGKSPGKSRDLSFQIFGGNPGITQFIQQVHNGWLV